MEKLVRPSWDEYFARIVQDVSLRSTCYKRQIGAIVVNADHEIVATGFNGNVRGMAHCDEVEGCEASGTNRRGPEGRRPG